jgi:hypothetical protein
VSTWTATTPGYRTKTVKKGNVTVVIHRPELTEKEEAKRVRIVETALANYGKHQKSYT